MKAKTQALDQRWEQAQAWLWDVEAEQLVEFDRLLNTADPRALAGAMRGDGRLAFDVRFLAALAYDELVARCADELVAIRDEALLLPDGAAG